MASTVRNKPSRLTLPSYCAGRIPASLTLVTETHYALDEVWNPRVGIANEPNSVSRRLPESVEVEADGTVISRQRYVGSFTQPLRLKSFPFDKQTFRVQLVAVRYTPNEVKFVPDQKMIDAGLKEASGIAIRASKNSLPQLYHRQPNK